MLSTTAYERDVDLHHKMLGYYRRMSIIRKAGIESDAKTERLQ